MEVDEIDGMINSFRGGSNSSIKLKDDIKIGDFKNYLSANYKNFNDLSPEPLSVIKNSPTYSTYYANK